MFLPWHSAETAEMAVASMRGMGISALKYRLGLLTSHFRANFPLKSCAECVKNDQETHGVGYWHLTHQLPGVLVCARHGTWLIESTLKATGAQRFDWVLPIDGINPRAGNLPSAQPPDLLLRLAAASIQLSQTPIGWHFHPAVLTQTLWQRLMSLGFASTRGRLISTHIGNEFPAYTRQLYGLDEFRALDIDPTRATGQACSYFHRVTRITHPVRHLLMVCWLYKDWQQFMEAYRANELEYELSSQKNADLETKVSSVRSTAREAFRGTCVELAINQGLSATAIAKQLQVTVTTVAAHLAEANIQTPKRPKTIRGPVRERLMTSLLRGESKQEAATAAGVSIESVTRFLLSEVGLHNTWTQMRRDQIRIDHRNRWEQLLQGNVNAPIKLLRSLAPNTYAWLYRHDRNWLHVAQYDRQSLTFKGGRYIDWEQRDVDLAGQIVAALNAWPAERPTHRMKTTDLLQRIPSLKAYLNQLDKLPRTQLLLRERTHQRSRQSSDMFTSEK